VITRSNHQSTDQKIKCPFVHLQNVYLTSTKKATDTCKIA